MADPKKQGPGIHMILICTCLSFSLLSTDDGIVIFDKIAEKIDDILFDHPSTRIHISGDFNIRGGGRGALKQYQ